MKQEVVIKPLINGYYVKVSDDLDGEDFVIEEPNTESEIKNEQIAFRNLCNMLRNVFAINNDKHHNQYLDITVSNDE